MCKSTLISIVCGVVELTIVLLVTLALNLIVMRFIPNSQTLALFVGMFGCIGTGLYIRLNHIIRHTL